MTAGSDIECLLKAIDEDREDWARYFILADAYEEDGEDERAQYWRWKGKCHIRADGREGIPTAEWFPGTHRFTYPSDLNLNLFNNLKSMSAYSAHYLTREEADEDLFKSYLKCLKEGLSVKVKAR